MIHSHCVIVQAVFYAVCGQCGAAGPEQLTIQDAHESALMFGWDYHLASLNGQQVTVHTCSACLAKQSAFDNPPIYATPLDPGL